MHWGRSLDLLENDLWGPIGRRGNANGRGAGIDRIHLHYCTSVPTDIGLSAIPLDPLELLSIHREPTSQSRFRDSAR